MGDRKQARDEEFQGFLVGRWSRLMRTAFLLTGEQHAAEDLVQTTLEQVYVAWRRVGSAEDPDAYVRRVMINAHARKHRRRLKEFLAPRSDSDLVPEPKVRVTWSDDTFVDVKRNRDDGWHADLRNPRIVDVKGAPASWFVALAPEGVGCESAKVTK
ncbi:sigma factor [Streptomyces europaeiscabiei]|uniref:sigma factor n=1 Tax=Streptomyces europaeiscabiei TaxID=146819 RepID=UPI002E11B5FB|nr:hypothetical protein OHB30_34860 [Streptomyces europaeiscabiei]